MVLPVRGRGRTYSRSAAQVSHQEVISLAAVARPSYDNGGNRLFDGMVGIYTLTVQRPKQRNRAGTKKMLCGEANRETYKQKLMGEVFPDIRLKLTATGGIVFNQQDHGLGHLIDNYPEKWRRHARVRVEYRAHQTTAQTRTPSTLDFSTPSSSCMTAPLRERLMTS